MAQAVLGANGQQVAAGSYTPAQQALGTSGTPNVAVAATNQSWAATMLSELGGPTFVTPNNIANVTSWMSYEEPPASWWRNNNPLNLTVNGQSAVSSMFPSLSASARAVANQLNSPDFGYPQIKAVLAQGNAPWSQLAAAVGNSQWGTSINASSGFAAAPTVTANGSIIANGVGNPNIAAIAHTCTAGSKGIQLDPAKAIPVLGNLAPSVTIFNACQVKAIVGGLAVAAGGLIMIVGVATVVAIGFKSTAAGRLATQAVTSGPTGAIVKGVSRGAGALTPQARRDRFTERVATRQAESGLSEGAKQFMADARAARNYSRPFDESNVTREPKNPNRKAG